MRRHYLILFLFPLVSISIFAIYFSTQIWDLDIVMPLDDVYIHFQYARQLAEGQPYVYNTGDPATSGATSFIYPYILAVGYLIGFQGLNLGVWAMVVGCLALVGAIVAIYRLCKLFDVPSGMAIFASLIFAITGSVSWHAMSGMETMLIVCFSLWTLLAYAETRLNLFAICAVVLALTRPEGSIMTGIAALMFAFRIWSDKSNIVQVRQGILLFIPLLAIGIQPALNYLLTGSFSASGSQAKSLLAIVPFDLEVLVIRIPVHIARFWLELFTGFSSIQDLWYLLPLIAPLGMIGWIILIRNRQYRGIAMLIFLWLITVSSAISTLDTAFWHLKRYQMPLQILFIPLAMLTLCRQIERFPRMRWASYVLVGLFASIFAAMTFGSFLDVYQLNTDYVRKQPLAMARWLNEYTADDALIAVHDVGMMRYVGERKTLDIVGLTTPNAAQYWRNGVGSVTEFLLEHQPDYIASYGRGHGYGLYMLADTRLYADPLVEYQVELDHQKNVALAADSQAIYQPDWNAIIPDKMANVLFDVNVANIASETAANYQWNLSSQVPYEGFATVAFDFEVAGCDLSHSQLCQVVEGARQLTYYDQFDVDIAELTDADTVVLNTRVHPVDAITLNIFVNDKLIDTQWIPHNPGYWFDIETQIPTNLLEDAGTIRIEPVLEAGERYVPARHTLVIEETLSMDPPQDNIAAFQDRHLPVDRLSGRDKRNGT